MWMLISTTFRYLHDIPYRPATLGGLRSNQVIRQPHATRRGVPRRIAWGYFHQARHGAGRLTLA
jgi:hypothetical protein